MVPISYNVRSLWVRKVSSAIAVIGIALVVFVFSGTCMLNAGIKRTLGSSGRPDNAIILRFGSDAELSSGIETARVSTIISNPSFVAQDKQGNFLGVGEIVAVITVERNGTDAGVSNLGVRGVPANVWDFRNEVKIIQGRKAKPGTDEVVIGKNVSGKYRGVEFGGKFELRKNRPVEVVGIFDAGGSALDSEVWGDFDAVSQAFRRTGSVSSVRVRLLSPTKLDAFKTYVESDKTMGLAAQREDTYYEKQAEGTGTFFSIIGAVFSVLFSFGAMIGAAITMYAQVSNRSREIGTLKALGFRRPTILLSFLIEAVILTLAGGAVGAIASLGLRFIKISTMNFATWSEVVFTFDPTFYAIGWAMAFAGIMGIIGGFFPAWRASKLSPVEAMRN
jgi:putative ABC transport system permease protein